MRDVVDRWDDSLVDPPLSEQNRRRNRGMRNEADHERRQREQAEAERDEARRLHECYCEDPVRLAMRGEPIPDGFGGHEPDCCIGEYYRQGERIIELEDELAQAKARVETLTAALRAITSGHCEDKRLHWLLPYEPVIYCECGWRMEVSLTPEEPR